MVAFDEIQHFVDQVVREFHPEKIILFGSYAYGQPTEDSDVDLMVVMKHRGRASKQSLNILHRLHPRFGLDLLVRSPDEIERRLSWNDFFIKEVIEKGKVLHEAPHK